MILDTSAITALLLREPGHEEIISKLGSAASVGIGAPTLTEAAIVLSARLRHDSRGLLARLLHETSIATLPFTDAHYAVAVDAWLRYGKGRHPAALNLGDCFSYATAKLARRPLLCVGTDFARTDLELA